MSTLRDFLNALVAYSEGKLDEEGIKAIRDFIPRVEGGKGLLACCLRALGFIVMNEINELLGVLDAMEERLFNPESMMTATEDDLVRYQTLESSLSTRTEILIRICERCDKIGPLDFEDAKNLLSSGGKKRHV